MGLVSKGKTRKEKMRKEGRTENKGTTDSEYM